MLSLFEQIRWNQNNILETNYADDTNIAKTLQLLRLIGKRNKSWELKYHSWLNIVNDDNYRAT